MCRTERLIGGLATFKPTSTFSWSSSVIILVASLVNSRTNLHIVPTSNAAPHYDRALVSIMTPVNP